MTPQKFVLTLAEFHFENVFNPYRDTCSIHDNKDAPQIRQKNLINYLLSAKTLGVDTLWMGRDLGYRGGRRTGLPLTDESHLAEFSRLFTGSRPVKATKADVVAERTAAEIWSLIAMLDLPPLLWNVFPFHPHLDTCAMTNRRFKANELSAVHHMNLTLLDMMGITKIVAIGRDAERYASTLGVKVYAVRHPSYGGLKDFRDGIKHLYPETSRNIQRDFFEEAMRAIA